MSNQNEKLTEDGHDAPAPAAPKWIEEVFTIKCRAPLGLNLSPDGEIDSVISGGQAEREGMKAGSWIVEIRSSKSNTFVDSLEEIQRTIEDIVNSGRTNFKIVSRREKTDEDETIQNKVENNVDMGPKEIKIPFSSHNPPPPPPPPHTLPPPPPPPRSQSSSSTTTLDQQNNIVTETTTIDKNKHKTDDDANGPLAFVPNRVAFWRRKTSIPNDEEKNPESNSEKAPPIGTALSEPMLSSNIKAPPIGTMLPMDVVEVKKLVKAAKPDPKLEKNRKELTKFLKDNGFLNFKEALTLFGAENVSELADDSLITEEELVTEVGFTKIQARRLKMLTQQYVEEMQARGLRSGSRSNSNIPSSSSSSSSSSHSTTSPRMKKVLTPTTSQGMKKQTSASQMKTPQSSSSFSSKPTKTSTPKPNPSGKSFLERQAEQEAKRLAKLEQSRLQKEAEINKEMKSTPTISNKGKHAASAGAASGLKQGKHAMSPRVTQSRSMSRGTPGRRTGSTPRSTPKSTPKGTPRSSPRTSPLNQGRSHSGSHGTLDLAATASSALKKKQSSSSSSSGFQFRDRLSPTPPAIDGNEEEEDLPRQQKLKKKKKPKRGSEEPSRSSSKLYESAAILKQKKEDRKLELERLQVEKELDMVGPDGRTKRQILADQAARKEQNKQRLKLRRKNSQTEAEKDENVDKGEMNEDEEITINEPAFSSPPSYSPDIPTPPPPLPPRPSQQDRENKSHDQEDFDKNRWNRGSINMLMEENKNGEDVEVLMESRAISEDREDLEETQQGEDYDEETMIKNFNEAMKSGSTMEVFDGEGMMSHFQNLKSGSFFEGNDDENEENDDTLRRDSDELRREELSLGETSLGTSSPKQQEEKVVVVAKEDNNKVESIPPTGTSQSNQLKDKLEQLEKMSSNIEGKIEFRRASSKPLPEKVANTTHKPTRSKPIS